MLLLRGRDSKSVIRQFIDRALPNDFAVHKAYPTPPLKRAICILRRRKSPRFQDLNIGMGLAKRGSSVAGTRIPDLEEHIDERAQHGLDFRMESGG
jgi:hypothetical protein